MLIPDQADAFVREWADAWNARDLERILAQWSDDCVFTSPRALRHTRDATVRGKLELRRYWAQALADATDLRFDVRAVYRGAESVVIGYRNHRGEEVAELIELAPDGRAVHGSVHHLSLPDAPGAAGPELP